MKITRVKGTLIISILLVMLLAITSCGTSTPSEGGTDQTEAPDQNIVVALPSEILTLDPHVSAGTPAESVRRHIYEGLVYADEQNNIHPRLAERWEVSDDNLTWTFYLKKGVKFHDGTPFNAEAVKISLERVLNPDTGSNRRYQYTYIDKIEVVDDSTIKIITQYPKASLLNTLDFGGAHIISPAALEEFGKDIANHPCGTGPYKLKDQVVGEYVLLEKFDDYWGGEPKLSEIKFVTVPEESTRVSMLETGEADYILGVPPQEIERLQSMDNIEVRKDESNRVAHIGFNTKRAPFDNPKVRQALSYAVNKDLIIQGVMGGIGFPAKSVIAPATWGYADLNTYEYNPEKAKQLLAEAGYPEGFKAKLWTPQGRYLRDKETTLAVAGQLAEIGIDLKVEVIDWGTYLKELKVGMEEGNKVEAYMLAWESVTGEASYIFESIFAGKNAAPTGWNTMFYTNQEVDQLVEKASMTLDDDQRAEYFKQIQELIMKDAPWIPLYVYEQVSAHRSNLKGVRVLPMEVPLFNEAGIE